MSELIYCMLQNVKPVGRTIGKFGDRDISEGLSLGPRISVRGSCISDDARQSRSRCVKARRVYFKARPSLSHGATKSIRVSEKAALSQRRKGRGSIEFDNETNGFRLAGEVSHQPIIGRPAATDSHDGRLVPKVDFGRHPPGSEMRSGFLSDLPSTEQ